MKVQLFYIDDKDDIKRVDCVDYYHVRKYVTSAIMQSKQGDSIYLKIYKK